MYIQDLCPVIIWKACIQIENKNNNLKNVFVVNYSLCSFSFVCSICWNHMCFNCCNVWNFFILPMIVLLWITVGVYKMGTQFVYFFNSVIFKSLVCLHYSVSAATHVSTNGKNLSFRQVKTYDVASQGFRQGHCTSLWLNCTVIQTLHSLVMESSHTNQ